MSETSGCDHYTRNCRLVAPCCQNIYPCRKRFFIMENFLNVLVNISSWVRPSIRFWTPPHPSYQFVHDHFFSANYNYFYYYLGLG